MFRFSKLTQDEIEREVFAASLPVELKSEYLDESGGLRRLVLPKGYVLDRLRTQIGQGREAFERSIQAFRNWAQFDLGWVRVANTAVPVESGEIVAVEVQSLGLWSVNLSQIVAVVHTDSRFGFIYKTTPRHVEEGEERFDLTLDHESGVVWYETEAVSRPRDLMALLAYPLTRLFQRRFARDSHRRMREAVERI